MFRQKFTKRRFRMKISFLSTLYYINFNITIYSQLFAFQHLIPKKTITIIFEE